MACMLPDAQMSEQERACCRMMQGDCGHMQMSSGHDCCQKVPQTTQINAVQWKVPSFHPVIVAAVYLATWHLSLSDALQPFGVSRPDASPPPESPPATISILRL